MKDLEMKLNAKGEVAIPMKDRPLVERTISLLDKFNCDKLDGCSGCPFEIGVYGCALSVVQQEMERLLFREE